MTRPYLTSRCARSKGVLDEIEGAARQPLGEVNADRAVVGQRRREPPRGVDGGFWHADVGVGELDQTVELPDGGDIRALLLDPTDEVRNNPRLNGRACGTDSVQLSRRETSHDR